MTKLSAWRKGYVVILFCVATAFVAPAQTFTTLFVFSGHGLGGDFPIGLVQGADGKLYGPANLGGVEGWGTVYRFGPSGATTLYNFCSQRQGDNCLDGQEPDALILATDFAFYGTTLADGAGGDGTVFKITSSGALTTLYSFGGGSRPYDGFVQTTDGNLYGTTDDAYIGGTIFKITPDGMLTTLYSFDGTEGGKPQRTTDPVYR
jgi:uncharacterized repeat protein (TIGR03803 family)